MIWHNLGFRSEGWKKIPLPAFSAKIPASNAPDFVQFADDGAGSNGVYTYAFDASTEESVYMSVSGFKDYKPGTDLYPQVVWTSTTSEANKRVCWGAEICTSFGSESFDINTSTLFNNEKEGDQDIVARVKNHTFLPKIDGSLLTSTDNAAIFRLYRDSGSVLATDDYTDDAFLITVNILYWANKIGESTRL